MSSSENYINYDVVTECANNFVNGANEIARIASELSTCNDTLVTEGWRNATARAYQERYEKEHKVALEKVEAAMRDVSTFLINYMQNRQDEDSSTASGI